MQLVVLVGFDETLKQFDAGSQFSPALCVRRALGFVKDSHVRHIRDNVYTIANGRFDGVKLMMQCQVGTIRLQHQRVANEPCGDPRMHSCHLKPQSQFRLSGKSSPDWFVIWGVFW